MATDEFTTLNREVAEKHPVFKKIGKIDKKKGKVWIEFSFPDGPPIEYERPGIELTDELVWRQATRPVEDTHHQRLSKLITPTAASNAVLKDTMRRVDSTWRTFRVYMGWDDKPNSMQHTFQQILVNPTTPSSTPEAQSSPTSSATSPGSDIANDLGITLPSSKELTLDLTSFRQDFNRGTKPGPVPPPPRGAFMILGMIEVYGEHARLTLNSAAAYDPKQGKILSMRVTPYNLVMHKQHPRGGN